MISALICSCLLLQVGLLVLEAFVLQWVLLASDLTLDQGLRRMACRGSGVRGSLAPFFKTLPLQGISRSRKASFLLPMRGDDPARCPVLVQKDEAVQALGAHLAKGAGQGI